MERIQNGSGLTLLRAQLQAFADGKYELWDEQMRLAALAETCRLLGDLADVALAKSLDHLSTGKDRLLALAEYADLCGPEVEKACLAIVAAAKPKPGACDREALWAICVLARGGKAKTNAEAIVATLEAHLPTWNDDSTNPPDAWKPFDDCLALPGCRSRLIALLGKLIVQETPSPVLMAPALRRIEALGKDAATLRPQLEMVKVKDAGKATWIDRILTGTK